MELILVLIIACAVLWIVWLSIRGRAIAVATAEDFHRQLKEIELDAMQNLMSASEDAYLKRMLSPGDYREVQKARIRAMLEYVGAISWNAALFVRAADLLRRNSSPEVARSAAAISKQALDLRLLSITANIVLRVRLIVPSATITPRGMAEAYGQVRRQIADVWRLESSLRAA